MKIIRLTQGLVAIVDDADYEWLNQWKWYADITPHKIYAARKSERKKLRMHRAIMGVANPAIEIDHWDGNGLNNRRSNLRLATKSQNQANGKLRSDNRSGFKGVHWSTNAHKWRALIRVNGVRKHLGLFSTVEAAHAAYTKAAKDSFGVFARP